MGSTIEQGSRIERRQAAEARERPQTAAEYRWYGLTPGRYQGNRRHDLLGYEDEDEPAEP
jgi:hypothetical protein